MSIFRKLSRHIVETSERIEKHRRELATFRDQFEKFKTLSEKEERRFALDWSDRLPQLSDATSRTSFDAHYIYHPAWATRLIMADRPAFHVDVSSSLTFSAMLSGVLPVLFFDYRPANLRLDNLSEAALSLTALPFANMSLSSISCMHVVEHIGLGRYGDSLDPKGDLSAMAELQRVVAPGGNLYFVVPVGQPRVVFNAHRIYSFEQITSFFAELDLRDFSLIPDNGEEAGLIHSASSIMADSQKYGCGCFSFKRPLNSE